MNELIRALWPTDDVPGNFTISLFPSGRSFHLGLDEVTSLDDESIAELKKFNLTDNIYFGNALRQPGLDINHRGSGKQVTAISSVFLDLDVYCADRKVHAATNLPKTVEEIDLILSATEEPSGLIDTGHGFAPFWLFDEPVIFASGEWKIFNACYTSWQKQIIAHANAHGLHVDQTSTVDRIWRLPGFMNVKSSPVPVSLVYLDATCRYSPKDLIGWYGKASTPTATTVAAATPDTPAIVVREPVNISDLRKGLATLANPEDRKIFDHVLNGRSFADSGSRDATMQKAASIVVWLANGKGTPESLATIFEPSLKTWADEDDADLTLEEEMGKMIDKIERAQADWDEHEKAEKARRQNAMDALGSRLFGNDYKPGTLTQNHLIIQHDRVFFFYHFKEKRYVGPHTERELLPMAKEALEGSEFPTTYVNDKGQIKQYTRDKLIHEYGEIARGGLEGDLSIQENRYDPTTRIFHRAMAPVRNQVKPVYNKQIDEWLALLGNNNAGQINDIKGFMAGMFLLDHQCAALCLVGKPGTGKTLFVQGLSRIFSNGPAKWDRVIGVPFNDALARCPLIDLSEGIDTPGHGFSTAFRDLVGSNSVQINAKFQPVYTTKGSPRIVIGSNNDAVLKDIVGSRELIVDDISAVAERLCYIDVGDDAADYLNSLPYQVVSSWFEGDIANHARWLKDNYPLDLNKRFLIGGDIKESHRRLIGARTGSEELIEWIVRMMSAPQSFERKLANQRKNGVASRLGAGLLRLNTNDVIDTWDLYARSDSKIPHAGKLGTILNNLSVPAYPKLHRVGDQVFRAHVIDTAQIFLFAEDNMLGDIDAMVTNLHREL